MRHALLHEAREGIQLFVLQADIDAVQREQRHYGFFHGRVAGALTEPEHGRVNHFDTFRDGHNRVGHSHSEIHVEMGFEALVHTRFHLPYQILHGVR